LYEQQKRLDAATGKPSLRGRKLAARLNRLRTIAGSASSIDPENPKGEKMVNYTLGKGGWIARLTGLIPRELERTAERREAYARILCRSVLEDATMHGWIPFTLPDDIQKPLDAALTAGFAAAKAGDFPGAINEFQKAHVVARYSPEALYNLGLAESKIPGHEFPSAAWFGAYLTIEPDGDRAPAVLETIRGLKTGAMTRLLKVASPVLDDVADISLREAYLADLTGLWARVGDEVAANRTAARIKEPYQSNKAVQKIAEAQAARRDFAGAFRTVKRINAPDSRSAALLDISRDQATAGDLDGALKTAQSIEDPFYRCTALRDLALEQIKAGFREAALLNLRAGLDAAELVPEANLKDVAKGGIATVQARAVDFESAKATLAGLRDPFQQSLTNLYIGEWQAKARDFAASNSSLAEGLRIKGTVTEDSSRKILEGAYNEIKARIDRNEAGNCDATARPYAGPDGWMVLREELSKEPLFNDQAAFMKSLPTKSPQDIFEALAVAANRMLDVSNGIDARLK